MKKTITAALIFIAILSFAAVGITYFSIEKTLEKSSESVLTETLPPEVAERIETGIDLDGTYDENDLIVESKTELINDAEVKIPQINGLKNKEVQEKINKEIYNECHQLVEKFPDINYGVYTERANFGNVFSVSFHVGDDDNYDQLYFNYELVTGEKLYLEDLFLKDADLTEIVRKAFYQSMVRDNSYIEGEEFASPDENALYKFVKGYMESDEPVFSFSASEICFYYKEYVASVRMLDIADKVSVYSKYMTDESIFENDNIGYDNMFTCADSNQYDGFEMIDYGYIEPNFWYDVTVWKIWLEDIDKTKLDAFEKFKAKLIDTTYDKIEEYRQTAIDNPEKFYILLAKPNINLFTNQVYNSETGWTYTPSNAAYMGESYYIYEMPMSLYESTYKDKIMETYRYPYFAMRGGAYFDPYDNYGADVTQTDSNKLYNYITGEELKTLEDVFAENSGYTETLNEIVKERLINNYEYSEDECIDISHIVEYKLDGTTVIASVQMPDEKIDIWISLNEFDKDMLKIFD